MKKSVYNFEFKNNDKKYLYNMLSTAIVELDENNFYNLINEKVNDIPDEIKKELYESGFIVDDDADEVSRYKYYYDLTRLNWTGNDLRLLFVPTYGCNLRCPYCYEGNKKNNTCISKEAIEKILVFVEKTIETSSPKIKKLTISLFGGEPTLYPNALELFCESISKISEHYNLEIYFDMTTNFTIVSERLLNLIKKYQIQFQVSIDGTKEMHNSSRITPDGKGTYDLIIQNLQKAISYGLKDLITIRINTDKEKFNDCEIVFEEMLNYSNDVYFGILKHYSGINDTYSGTCMDKQSIVNAFSNKIFKLYKKHGLEVPVMFGKANPCSLNAVNKYMIDNKLNVYKCELLLNNEEYKIGYIDNNGNLIKNESYYKQMAFSPFNYPKCVNCKFLPLCAANCPGEVILSSDNKDGSIPRGDCALTEQKLRDYLIGYVSSIEE